MLGGQDKFRLLALGDRFCGGCRLVGPTASDFDEDDRLFVAHDDVYLAEAAPIVLLDELAAQAGEFLTRKVLCAPA